MDVSPTSLTFGAVAVMFLIYITAKGDLARWIGLFVSRPSGTSGTSSGTSGSGGSGSSGGGSNSLNLPRIPTIAQTNAGEQGVWDSGTGSGLASGAESGAFDTGIQSGGW